MIQVNINGEPREVPEGTVVTLLETLGLHPQLIVVERNREILDRGAYAATTVVAGDTYELVHFVGGG
ncbi:MAG: sulfur carrier protein ThiS [Longimicrobiales bacterium]